MDLSNIDCSNNRNSGDRGESVWLPSWTSTQAETAHFATQKLIWTGSHISFDRVQYPAGAGVLRETHFFSLARLICIPVYYRWATFAIAGNFSVRAAIRSMHPFLASFEFFEVQTRSSAWWWSARDLRNHRDSVVSMKNLNDERIVSSIWTVAVDYVKAIFLTPSGYARHAEYFCIIKTMARVGCQ